MRKILIMCLLFNTLYASTDERLNLYGGVSGNETFQQFSVQVIEKLTNELAACKKRKVCPAEDIFNVLGTLRGCVAHETNSLYADLMGRQRLGDPEQGDRVFSDTPLDLYPMMAERIRRFILKAIAGQTPGPNKVIPLKGHLGTDVDGRIIYELVENALKIQPMRHVTEASVKTEFETALKGKGMINNVTLSYSLVHFQPDMLKVVHRPEVSEDLRILYMEIFRKINGTLMPERSVIALLDGANLKDPMMPITLIHPIASSAISKPFLGEIHKLLEKALLIDGAPGEKKRAIAEFLYRFSVFMPYARGSAAIGEWLLQALCNVHKLDLPSQPTFSHLDQMAQSSFTFEDFWNIYKVFWGEPIILQGVQPGKIKGLEWLNKS